MGMSTVTAAAAAATAGALGAFSGYMIGSRGGGQENGAANLPPMDPLKAAVLARKEKKMKKKDAAASGGLMEGGNADEGAKLFKAKCATCHTVHEGGATKQGPNLYGIMGAKAAVRHPQRGREVSS